MAKAATQTVTAASFTGFTPRLFAFFDGLAENQDRDWFQANRDAYEKDVREPLGALVEALAFAFAAHDIPLTGDAKRSLFRIHRDIRFSKDKRPYKTNASAVLSRDGTKPAKGVLYFHIGGPQRDVFMAMGFYGPEPAELAAIRRAIAARPDRWAAMQAALGEASLSLDGHGALSRIPKGFEAHAGEPIADALKLRNFLVSRHLETERLYEGSLVDDIVAFAQGGLPLLTFGWGALAG